MGKCNFHLNFFFLILIININNTMKINVLLGMCCTRSMKNF